MSIRRLVLAITFLSIFVMATRISMDTDSWWHMRTGQWILENGAIPKSDPFSFTHNGQAWRYPSAAWLSQITMYGLYARFGPGMLNLYVAALVTLAFVFVHFTLSGGLFTRAFTLILAAATSGVYWAARPYLATFVLTAVFLWILEDYRWGRSNRLLWLPLVMIAWVNLHPGFAVGFILVGIYALSAGVDWLRSNWEGRGRRFDGAGLRAGLSGPFSRLLLLIPLLLVAASLNPTGPALLGYPFETLSIGVLRDVIQEWQSPNFHVLQMQPFAWLLLLTFAAVGASKRRLALTDFLLFSVFTLMALLAGRNIALFALAAPAVLTRHAAPVFQELRLRFGLRPFGEGQQSTRMRWLNAGLAAILVLVAVARIAEMYPVEASQVVYAEQLPLGAVGYLQAEMPPGRLFNSYNWGGYLIWALPEYPVFVDGRTDLYGDQFLGEFLHTLRAEPGWQQELEHRGINLVLIEPDTPLAKVLPYEGWQVLYLDELSVLYAHP